ncbi:hypothetical protein N9383_03685 [Granulosicoccus sp.]|nr:hypothetical protein [Granulosicoccus sp.]
MVDRNKRSVLKSIGGAAAILITPGIASAHSRKYDFSAAGSKQPARVDIIPASTGAELSIELSVHPAPFITLNNHSDEPLVIKNVYPGIIHAGAQTFDINSIFKSGAFEIDAGDTRTLRIQPITGNQTETRFARSHYRNKPQRIVSVTGHDNNGMIVNSTRSFFA